MTHRPNVVILVTHDTGQFVSPYGYDTVYTPACERLAAEGQTCTRSFCTSPLCSPSRASIFTGRFPHQNGVMGLTSQITGGFDLSPGEHHAASLFADAGYESVLCGFEHESLDFIKLGFSGSIHGTGSHHNGGESIVGAGDAIASWLENRDGSVPFYLQIGAPETHRRGISGFGAPPDSSGGVWMPPYLIDDPEVREEMAELQGAVRQFDTGLGNILAALDRRGVSEGTIFIATTDHGIDMPRAKGTFYDPGIETFLFARFPGVWGSGVRHDELISNVDILPTLLDACGLTVPENIQGRSFLGLLEGSTYEPRTYVFGEKIFHDTYDPVRSIRSEGYKFIKNFEVNVLYDVRLGTLPRYRYFKGPLHKKTSEELYDLFADPLEENNLIDDPEMTSVSDEMRRALARWMADTDDPLLEGPISSPLYHRAIEQMRGLNEAR